MVVICPYYTYIGACPRGSRCPRLHVKPSISRTLLFSNIYQRPNVLDVHGNPIDSHKIQQHCEDFYEDFYEELSKYGEIVSLNICDNLADHLAGNVYVIFGEVGQARNALRNLQGRMYAGRTINVEFSPVTDLREGECGAYKYKTCQRGRDCNFLHLRSVN